MKNIIVLGLAAALAGGCRGDDGVDTGAPEERLGALFINEFIASNHLNLQDESGSFPDWIEIYNAGPSAVDLGGWWFSDDAADPMKWQVPPHVLIPSHGYLVFFADKDPEQGPLHLDFRLSAGGGDITLHAPHGSGTLQVDAVLGYAPQPTDRSLARMPDGASAWQEDVTPTPAGPNE